MPKKNTKLQRNDKKNNTKIITIIVYIIGSMHTRYFFPDQFLSLFRPLFGIQYIDFNARPAT